VRVVRGERVPSLDRDVSWKLPGGGFVSPIGDLARFGSALLSERLLDADLKREMWTPRKLADGKATRYGYGFNVETKDGRRRVFHSGAQEKTATFLLLFPDEPGGGLGAAVMCQNEGAKTGGLADAAAALVRKRRAVEAAETAPPRAR
jgi:CubicO group peptidase (beta-lactamase class C family)